MKTQLRKALILAALCAGVCTFTPQTSAQHGLLREVYTNVFGGISGFTNDTRFPGSPSSRSVIPEFETPQNVANNYGQRVRGYVVAPVTGSYIFWIASDDQSQLFLSTDERPENKRLIAQLAGAVPPRAWEQTPSQRSSPVLLEAGKRYYIEALMVEGGGSDHLAVRWQIPTTPTPTIEEPIPGNRLYVELIPPQIVRDPPNITVTEREPATFSVQLVNQGPISYQWMRNGAIIPGATNATFTIPATRISDHNTRYSVVLTNEFGAVTSREGLLFVNRDLALPTVISAQNTGDRDLVAVTFSEALDPQSATVGGNYQLSGGAVVLGATLDSSGRVVILRTTPLQLGQTYSLGIENVRDLAAQPNTIEPETRVDFTVESSPLSASRVYGRPEQVGPSTRRGGLIISEIMYNPRLRPDGRNMEFVELYNTRQEIQEIGGFQLTGAVQYTFPAGTFISPTNYLIVAASPNDLQLVYGLPRVEGPFTGALPNNDGLVQLRNEQGAVLLSVEYGSQGPWPVAPDGAGHSLVLARPSYGEADPRAWSASVFVGGTPGRGEPAIPSDYQGIVINEFLAHTDFPQLDVLEIFNYSAVAVDLSGVWISDRAGTNRFTIPGGTILQPMGMVAFDEAQLGFALDSSGERILLRTPSGTRVIDAVRFGPQPNGISFGRYPDGSPVWTPLQSPTKGTANAPARVPDVVINEIMYNPVSGNQDEEYIELYNRTTQAINLAGWRFEGGINYTFPANTFLPANGYFVVAKDIGLLRAGHAHLNSLNSSGNFSGNLSNGGERVALTRPEISVEPEGTTTDDVLVDEVSFETGGRWGTWADGGGSSLELVDPNAPNDFGSNWVDSDETQKSQWTTITRRGIMDHGATNFFATAESQSAHVLLMGEGEALIDNVRVVPDGGTNIVRNPGFAEGMTDWVVGGSHDKSTLNLQDGSTDSSSLHIRADHRGDTASNRIRSRFYRPLTNGTIVTMSADGRWLRGTPEILLRLHGNYLEVPGIMDVPKNLGTPGLRNSRALNNAGPAITDVLHSPVLPLAGQGITVSAQVRDNQRVLLSTLRYRVEPSSNYVAVPMSHHGAGFYSARIPGQPNGAMVDFYIEAMDSSGAFSRFPADAPAREAQIKVGEFDMDSHFGVYRLWVSDHNLRYWTEREQSSNAKVDATFVYNDERVIYNMETLYSGSPFHWNNYNSPLGNSANYVMVMPKDDLFLGQQDFVLNLPSNLGSDTTGVREQIVFWMAEQLNQPANHRRYHHLFINGVDRGNGRIFEDAQQPNRDFVEQWYPEDSDGELYKIEDWFEFSDGFSRFNLDAELEPLWTTNLMVTPAERELKLERYRWWFRKRAVRDSTHDYSELLHLVEAVNTTNQLDFEAKVDALIDVDEWMGAIALRHAVGDWDAFGYARGKNMYLYKPVDGKWQLLHWDAAFAFGLGDPVNWDLFDVEHFDGTIDEVTKRMMETPRFRRAYLRAFQQMVDGPFLSARVDPIIDAKFRALVDNGIAAAAPNAVKDWIAQRRTFIQQQIAGVTSGFSISNNGGDNYSTNRNTVVLRGNASVQVKTIRINGVDYPVTWTGVTSWETRVALQPGQNVLQVQGFDAQGNVVVGADDAITITYTGLEDQPAGRVVFSEIQYHPFTGDAEFVELHNTSRNSSFDLSGYRVNGLNFTFPGGSVISPGGFLILVRDPVAFGEAYGYTIPVIPYDGALDNGGETLTLFTPAPSETPIASIRYDDELPWFLEADGLGPSLQLIDPAQDATRVGNWTYRNMDATPGATNSTRTTFTPFPQVWVNEVKPVDAGGPWVELYNSGNTEVSLAGLFLTDDYSNLMKWAFPAGSAIAAGERKIVRLDGRTDLSTPSNLHANFTLAASNGTIGLVGTQAGRLVVFDYLTYSALNPARSYGAFPEGQAVVREIFGTPTPGAANTLTIAALDVSINEWMAANTRTVADPDDGDFDDWFELYNAGSQPADLSGFTLTDNPAIPGKFNIPNGTVIPARGFLLIWADEENATNGQVHVNFRLSANGETIGLYAPDGTEVDRVDFGPQTDDISEGRAPDGASTIQPFTSPTPGAPNGAATGFRFSGVAVSQGTLSLEWNSDPGQSYRVEYKNSLNDPTWTLLRTVASEGSTTSTTDTIGGQQRFYRLVEE